MLILPLLVAVGVYLLAAHSYAVSPVKYCDFLTPLVCLLAQLVGVRDRCVLPVSHGHSTASETGLDEMICATRY